MYHLARFISLALLISSCSDRMYAVRDEFDKSSVPPAPDYSLEKYWASLPGKKDAADSIPAKSGLRDLQASAKADVFFVYPTIFTKKTENDYHWNADVNDGALNNKIQLGTILNQASAFNGVGKVYAPYYRQAHLYAFYTQNKRNASQAFELAYEDVKTAFEYYLAHYNQGQPIVIASHSQGSYHAERLLKDFFDGKELKSKLIVAYLIGRAIKPDAFTTIHPSEKPDEVGVWASWNTFARDHYPSNYEQFFKGAVSTNPLLWNSSETFAEKELNGGGVGPHFTFIPHLADAQNHEGMLWINKPYIRGRFFLRTKRWHYADINLFYMNLRENAALRVEKFMQK
jgi:Protein of unknown function (DUF3089)